MTKPKLCYKKNKKSNNNNNTNNNNNIIKIILAIYKSNKAKIKVWLWINKIVKKITTLTIILIIVIIKDFKKANL